MAGSFLAWLSWCEYISINWTKIDCDITHFVAKSLHKNKDLMYRINRIITHTIPLIAGFSASFYYGFKYGS